MIDLAGLGALALVGVEWLGLGWLSGVTFPPPRTPATWALRVLVGGCLVAFAQLALALAGVGFASIPVVLVLACAGAAALRASGGAQHGTNLKQVPPGVREQLGWLIFGAVLAGALVRAFLVPESGWDAYSHWGLRAQAFATAGTVVDAHSEHEYYPPLVPLLEAWLYLHRGVVDINLGKTVWAVVGGAFAVCLAWHLRLSLRSAWLAPFFATAIVLASPMLLESFWTGQADLALTAYFSLAALAVYQWLRAPDRAWLIQVVIFGAAAVLSKFEGLPRVAVLALGLVVVGLVAKRRDAWRPLVTLVIAAAVAVALWTVAELTRGIAPSAEHLGALQLRAIPSVLFALISVFGGVRTGGGLVVAALAWIVAGPGLLKGKLSLLTLVAIGELLATLVAFLVSSTAPDLEVRTSATRLFEQFMPLALLVGAVGLDRLHL